MESKGSKNILIVEDDENSFLYLLFGLEDTDYLIHRANNGLEAIEIFKQRKINFEFILMDLKMPVIDGFEASEAIRKIDPEVLIIAQTASFLPLIEQKLKDYGFDGVIIKPFTINQLNLVIENILHSRKSILNTSS